MVSRKPKGIADDIVGGIRDIVSPWLGTPPGEARQVTKAKEVQREVVKQLDQNLAGGMIGAGVQGNKALVKQAAINAAALGVGYGVGKVFEKVAPIVSAKLGNEIGVHVSNVDKLKKITYSSARAGSGNPGYYADVESGATYKFSPYRRTDYEVDAQGYISSTKPTEIVGRMDTETFTKSVAANIQDMSRVTENPTHKFAYITKSKPGINDEDWETANAFTVAKQKVLQKVELPQIIVSNYGTNKAELDLYDKTKESITKALLRQQAKMQSNTQTALNTVRGVAGVGTQKTGSKLNNKNKKR